jgi:hypothetical protein
MAEMKDSNPGEFGDAEGEGLAPESDSEDEAPPPLESA